MGVTRRLTFAAFASLCLFGVSLLVSAPAALAVSPPAVEEEAALDVAATSATLQAKINPEGSETTYRFEYGTSEAYGSSVPVPDGLVGSGMAGVTVSAHPQNLSPATTYHYRVVALVSSRGETVPGGGGTFTTQPSGGEFALPDGRQWELVSPPNKHGALIKHLPGLPSTAAIQAAEDGSGFSYQTNVPTELEPAGYVREEQILSSRGPQGWLSRDISPPHETVTHLSCNPEYQSFSQNLSSALVFPDCQDERSIRLSSEATADTPYVRHEALCDSSANVGECYQPILTSKEGFADIPAGMEFEFDQVRVEGSSRDLNHMIFWSRIEGLPELFEWSASKPPSEALAPISVLPNGEEVKENSSIGVSSDFPWKGNRHAISEDGSRVVWKGPQEEGSGGVPGTGHLYVRDLGKRETVRLDEPQPGLTQPSGSVSSPVFQIASSDDSKVFFTDLDEWQRLTVQSGSVGQDLYECEIVEEAGKLACRLTDLTPEVEGQSAGVRESVLGASEDGSYVYFAAEGVLGDGSQRGAVRGSCKPGEANGTCNLYEYHNGEVTFIAALSVEDSNDWGQGGEFGIGRMAARVSPDGRYLTFMSAMPLTGYDNNDTRSGQPDQEVYLYDASTGRLVCASCNPTGSRPTGVEEKSFAAFGKELRPNIIGVTQTVNSSGWIAANIAPSDYLGGFGEALYQPRALSDSGRLFFNSSDGLVPQDVNGQEDVYEFEPAGGGSCTGSSSTFSSKSGGCVSLISSGTSAEESGFLDASTTGDDVFFLTSSRLASQDFDSSYDVYDAHECSASVPCVSTPVASPPCDSGDACKAPPSPQPSILGSPASATFSGAGNLIAGSPPATVLKDKPLTRAQQLARALKACRKKSKRARSLCERQARKRYAPKTARRSGTKKGKG